MVVGLRFEGCAFGGVGLDEGVGHEAKLVFQMNQSLLGDAGEGVIWA
jgi:hypothetical protein